MANTLKKIQTVTVGAGGAASIDFTSIPQTFTDLKIVLSARGDAAATHRDIIFAFNGSTSNFTGRSLYGTGSGTGSNTNAFGVIPAASQTASVFGNGEIYIPNYTSANNKSFSGDFVTENNGTQSIQSLVAFLWSQTAAITSIALTLNTGNFVQYSTATLYGVANVTASSSAYATGGNQIYTDNTYWYHVFTSSGTFTPARSLTCDYLVIGGGGSGGNSQGGGGGAGGYLTGTTSAISTAQTVTVGAGSPANTGGGLKANDSVFGSITATGGGNGGNGSQGGGGGGSGGGGAAQNVTTSGGAGTSGQGTNGAGGASQNAGGGGGSSQAASGRQGGNGTASSITGTSITRAGGGSGGGLNGAGTVSGGSGGGGAGTGDNTPAGSDGTINTGSGGGGGGARTAVGNASGGAGGSGIVIVRYAV